MWRILVDREDDDGNYTHEVFIQGPIENFLPKFVVYPGVLFMCC